jgi:hypothetical protein
MRCARSAFQALVLGWFCLAALAPLAGCQDSEVSRVLGARCDRPADCDDLCLVPSEDWPGGFCTQRCTTDRDCPLDAACIEEDGGVCAFACDADPGCTFLGAGYECKQRDRTGDTGEVMVCRG